MINLKLYLFLSSETPHSQLYVKNIKVVLEKKVGDQYEIQCINLLDHAELCEEKGVFVTPTLERVDRDPPVRVIADLSSVENAAAALRLLLNNHK